MPQTLSGKMVLLLWVLCLSLLFASLNASITSSLTVALNQRFDQINSFDDLSPLRLVGMSGSGTADLAGTEGLGIELVATPEEGLKQIRAGKADALVFSPVKAEVYLKAHHEKNFMFSDFILGHEQYAFALPYGSPLRKAIDVSIISYQNNQSLVFYCQKYLGAQAKACKL